MAAYLGGESIVDALLTKLGTRLPTLLALVQSAQEPADAVRGAPIDLLPPAQYLFGKRTVDPLDLPAVLAWEEDETFTWIGGGSGIGGSDPHNWTEGDHRLAVVAVLATNDEEVTERMLCRYWMALWRFFAENPYLMVGGRSYALTPIRAGRDSMHGGRIPMFAPGQRQIAFDITVGMVEDF